ncbi:Hsp70 family protein [Cladophialophora carrionii]|uniref:Hsp70 family protein n=1 Tax=Cladophialophora carrionii TaxID=86049 RepID=A0A1C1CAA5_9EURO|nr:Hsp70 family protein [Cladophialophora carrionii]
MALPENRLIIGLDYGTTHSGISYALVGRDQDRINGNARHDDQPGTVIHNVTSWSRKNAPKVPSIISYSPADAHEAQWGTEISRTGIEMIWTKLQLEEQHRLDELDLLLKALDGMANLNLNPIVGNRGLPSYPAKEPVGIVTDYLSRLRAHFVEKELTVDIVLTCPIEWSDSAKAKTFQAITRAGFDKKYFPKLNEIILASEPEAAVLFVLKSIQHEDDAAPVGDCIVHCDAGGGTVDVGSFRIKQVEPDLILENIGLGAGKKAGSTFVDRGFLRVLWNKLGAQNYEALAGGTLETSIGSHSARSPELSEIMEDWEAEKRHYRGQTDHERDFYLPRRLHHLEIPQRGVTNGQVRITGRDLQEAFKFSIDSTIELITGQIGQVECLGWGVKLVTLSGGFACSDYLYNQIKDEIYRTRNIRTRRPVDERECWAAVARGAVLYGLQHDTSRFVYMRACLRNYGMRVSQQYSAFKHSARTTTYQDQFDGNTKAGDQMIWLIKRGDLILSNKGNYSSVQICRRFGINDDRFFTTALLANDDDEVPEGHLHKGRISVIAISPHSQDNSNDGPEMNEVARLRYDLSDIPEREFDRMRMSNGRNWYYQANLTFHLLVQADVQFWVTFGETELARATFPYV